MRKIMILFVASIVIVLSGCFVFAAEVSHIDVIETVEKSKSKTESIVINEKTKNVVLDTSLYDQSNYSIVNDIYIVESRQDSTLAPNEVVLEYNDKFATEVSELGDTTTIKFSSELTWIDINGNSLSNFQDYLDVWKNKTVTRKSIDPEYFNIKVRYGSNVRILDSDSQEYQNEYLDTGEQYY
ncbi:hypothetical protein [Faecalitalea cylindroides]|uniref:hypothetical protein n=1 Tax=Faecalitalea cylindroides TaxID=39483 RepID=UPI00232C5D74|nr:hypothetical protein [Faecalitalea cylindroides]MDB7953117.1 hypothetical protein [Faecalitalea cylindroides]MDB7959945.1 hypothetical protein [Faecalitalea cylindroides]MDB7961470.1 hypothetical protein [Faecalitalea cylindroides]MDB7963693.1 hypothetical protein [Faecalitalea cylindroides]MDB7965552.1 hypothetical protein [Faecalitalea cylindroides]